MATYSKAKNQSTLEAYTYTVDFSNDLPSGGTVTAGTAIHIPPSGSASSITTSVTSPYVYVSVPTITLLGTHYVDVLATINSDTTNQASVRIPINVLYPSPVARSGMVDIITELREMTDSGIDDYTVAGIPYWTDAQLQRVLDNHRTIIKYYEMTAEEEGTGEYFDYSIGYGNLEQTTGGTAIFIVQDINAAAVSSASYSVDYTRGVVTFASDTAGAVYYVTGRSYNLNDAAAEIWKKKQGHYHTAVDFSTDNHRINRAQLYEHAKEQAAHYQQMGSSAMSSMSFYRPDTDE